MDLPLEYASEQGLKRVALVYGESAFPTEVADGVRAKASSLGMVLVLDEVYLAEGTDFGSLAQRIRSAAPDIVIGGTYLDDSIALIREMKRADVSPGMIVLTVGPALREFGDALGDDANGVMGVVSWMRSGRVPMAYDFWFRYKEKYGSNAAAHAAYGYGGGQVLEGAVRLAGTLEKDKLREQLRTLKFQSILGNYRVNEQGLQTAKRTLVMQWQNGFRLLVLPEPNADVPVAFPFKPWSER
jgi:branched-chain amino acid transport system substrate-binding protein